MSNTDRPGTDRPTTTYPTADHLARLEREEAAHRERLADLWADRTPTEELPAVTPFVRTNGPSRHGARIKHEQAPSQPALCQDMWRPRWLPAWHPSLMQLAIGAALVLAILGACNVAAINAHRAARAHCHALVVSDWARAERECRGTGEGTPQPEQVPGAPAPAPQQTPSAPAPAEWTVHGTDSPYSKDDPAASPLDLPRCTTAPDTPMPCLAHISNDSRHVTVLEEDASLTGLDLR